MKARKIVKITVSVIVLGDWLRQEIILSEETAATIRLQKMEARRMHI